MLPFSKKVVANLLPFSSKIPSNSVKFGKIAFLYNRNARPITGYGTIGSQSLWQSFVQHVRIQGKGISRVFYQKEHYEDRNDNLVKP